METLSATVRAQANGNMNDYFPKTILAKKIEVRETQALLGVGHPGMRMTKSQSQGLASLSERDSCFFLALLGINPRRIHRGLGQQCASASHALHRGPEVPSLLLPPLSPWAFDAVNIWVGRKGKVWGLEFCAVGGRAP